MERVRYKDTIPSVSGLEGSGLTPETVRRAGLRRVSASEISDTVGFKVTSGGWAFPYPGNGFARFRLDTPHLAPGWDKPARYLTPKGAGTRLYVPPTLSPEVIKDSSVTLMVTEGEKKALKAVQEGIPCIAVAGIWAWLEGKGEGQDLPDSQRILADFDVIVWRKRKVFLLYDSDITRSHPGYPAFERLGRVLEGRGAVVRVLTLPALGKGKTGLDDYLVAEGPNAFWGWLGIAGSDPEPKAQQEPELAADAMYGLAGRVVEGILPYTEADPVGLLLGFLAGFGVMIGNQLHWRVSGVQHPLRIFPVLVGVTSKGRKGTSWEGVRQIFKAAVPDFSARVQTGLTSGEGLIWAVRDAIYKMQIDKKTREAHQVLEDEGVGDKRLLVLESEFGRVLRVAQREGNTLSAVIRLAWEVGDDDVLQILNKNSPAKATGAHVSVVGHITADELGRLLHDTDAASGFANRFLFAEVRRSKVLPFGADIPEGIGELAGALSVVLGWGEALPKPTILQWAPEAARVWARVYPVLSEGQPGLMGAVLGRAEAQVLRLAGLYAVLDMKVVVDVPHLRAALAVWDYAAASTERVFGERFGDPVTATIWGALQHSQLTRTQIRDLFQRHQSAVRIEAALGDLLKGGKVVAAQVKAGGRPATVYRRREV